MKITVTENLADPCPSGKKSQGGFTLLELLVALVITGAVVSAAYGIYVTQHENWIIQEQVSDMQQNARTAMHELENRIRMAGYGLPSGVHPISAANSNPDTAAVFFKNESGCEATVEHNMTDPTAELRCDGHDLSCFGDTTWAYIYDPAADTGEYFFISQVQVASYRIQHGTDPLSRAYPSGSRVMYVDMYKFYIDATDSSHPNLVVARGRKPELRVCRGHRRSTVPLRPGQRFVRGRAAVGLGGQGGADRPDRPHRTKGPAVSGPVSAENSDLGRQGQEPGIVILYLEDRLEDGEENLDGSGNQSGFALSGSSVPAAGKRSQRRKTWQRGTENAEPKGTQG